MKYTVKQNLKPSGLIDISGEQINDHWKLYEGYVTQTNKLNEDLKSISDPLTYADRRRRYGFEYNGIVLHEYYFENLKANGGELQSGDLKTAIVDEWGSYENWKTDFANCGKTRGIGWAILYSDPQTKQLLNAFIAEHEIGHIAGFKPILVMDIWEHAYMLDHKAGGRPDYITAFLKNINWEVVQARF